MNDLDGGGIYSQDSILSPFKEPTLVSGTKALVPQIDEIRVIEHNDEMYINAKDLTVAMNEHALRTNPTMSVLHFIRMFTIELITARR